MAFLLLAYDGADAKAASRRETTRSSHFDYARPFAEDGVLLIGGRILDEDGKPQGSMAVLDMQTKSEVQAWIDADPYFKRGVWKNISILPYEIADLPFSIKERF